MPNMSTGRLAYVTISSTDVPRTASIMSQAFGLARVDAESGIPAFAVGETAIAVVAAGDALLDGDIRPGVHHLSFAADDPESAAAVAAARLSSTALPKQRGIGRHDRIGLPAEATEGVRTYFSRPLAYGSQAGSGLVERIDHLGIVCPNTDRAIEVFHRRLGLVLESQQIDVETQFPVESFTSDKYGAVYHSRSPAFCGGVRSAFITVGDCELEFLQDYSPLGPGEIDAHRAGTTRQDRGAIARFLASRGPGLAHIALKTPDIGEALTQAEAGGCELIDAVGRPGGRRSRIAFIHPRSTGGVLFHFVQRE